MINPEMPRERASEIADIFLKLVDVIAALRGENGCPWDKEQTRDSVKMNLVEEAYEALDAIREAIPSKIASELGDLMIQVLFHSQISQELGEFDVGDVLSAAIDKLVRRHPHVFSDAKVSDSKEVLKNWEDIKKVERGGESVLADIPQSLPGFLRALVVQDKVGRVGFEWPDKKGAILKVREELAELEEALASGRKDRIDAEYGDLILIVLNLGRYIGSNPDDALRDAVMRFEERFKCVELALKRAGMTPSEATLELMDSLWDECKSKERRG
ncbi:nucleoside triphosphate pyrophosphohydrolase [bacterium]|nr:nucleoside triphosphate pyrophosphohydrolase [bacterium]